MFLRVWNVECGVWNLGGDLSVVAARKSPRLNLTESTIRDRVG